MTFIGVEAGGTKIVCGAGTGPADLHDVVTFPTTSPPETTARIREYVAARADGLRAVGVASFGPVDLHPSSGTYGYITSTPKPGWAGTDLLGPLRAATDVPIGFDTDVNGAALAEARWGAATDVPSCVYVTVGTGIGGGGYIGGALLHGLLHPEMGHLPVRRQEGDDYAGGCPYHGDCLEGMASGPAIAARWGEPAQDLRGERQRRAVAVEAGYLAQMAAAMTYLLSPARLIFGGGVMHLPGLLDALRTRAVEQINGYIDVAEITERSDRYIVAPGLGDHAGLLGAIALAADAHG
ncbi:MAG TPA: ROK family protein [Euzebyales bacterium]|nr:ROK family protein [Euzebyales bacterium]